MGSKYVVAVGDPFDGLTLFGPFPDAEEANEWADDNARADTWRAVALQSPVETPVYLVTTAEGVRAWTADDPDHAREQHVDAFPDEPILAVARLNEED